MQQYLDLLKNIIENGVEKESGRENMPNTIGISHAVIQMNLSEGFPLLTTKKLHFRGIVNELLWFLRGDTNIKWLVENGTNIWNGDAYRWYQKHFKLNSEIDEFSKDTKEMSYDEFVKTVKENHSDVLKSWFGSKLSYSLGDLGKVYGYQWRNQNGVDQVRDVIEGLKNNPYSRYHIIDGWNKADFPEMALPPCHLLYQFIVRPLSLQERSFLAKSNHYEVSQNIKMFTGIDDDKHLHQYLDEINIPKFYLDLNMYQRSCDTMLGVPYNIASMSILLKLFAKVSNMLPGIATWIGGDTHLYVNHLPAVDEQLARETKALPTMEIKKEINTLEDILALRFEDFGLEGYDPHPKLENPTDLFTGIKKLSQK